MAREKKVRQQLIDEGRFTDDNGTERARLSYDSVLVINEEALYRYILRASARYARMVPVTKLYMAFGMTGGWSPDGNVSAVLEGMSEKKVLHLFKDKGDIFAVWPMLPPQQALKKLNPYTTREAYIAGLEPIE